MTSMLPNRRRAEELADAIDGRSPARNAEVRELVAIAAAMQATSPVLPRADFTAELRAQLVAAAHRELSSPADGEPTPRSERPRRSGYRRLGVAAATGAFVVVGGTTGIASASENALPGDLLYPVKRGVEQIDLALTTNETEQGRLELKLAETRLDEVSALLESDDPIAETLIAETLEDFTRSAEDGSDLLLKSEDTSDPAEAATLVNAFAVDSSLTLNVLAPGFDDLAEPVDAVRAFSGAAEMMATIDAAATQQCPTCLDEEDSVSVTDPGGGDPPVLTVTDPDGEPVVSVTVPDIPGTGGSAGPPAGGSGHVHPQAPVVGGAGGYLPTPPDLPTPTPDTTSSGGGTAGSPPATSAPLTSDPTAPGTGTSPTAPQPTDPTFPTVPTTPVAPTPPTPATEAPTTEQMPPVPEAPETTDDVDPETDSEVPDTDGDTQSEPVPTDEPTLDTPAEPLPDPLDDTETPDLADTGDGPAVAGP
jgi:hypothetical protein